MDYVSLVVQDHIGIVTMNRPPVNSFNLQFYQEMMDTFRSINSTGEIWVAILRAEGKQFCTGNDVKEFTRITDLDSAVEYARRVSDGIGSVYECAVPVIGAINGMALGTGLALASCCDILVAAENARFGIPEISVGIIGAACFISRMLPQQLHRYMSYSGDIMTADEMKHYGAVLKIVPQNQLFESSLKVAEHLLNNPPRGLRGFKAAINKNEDARLKEKYAVEISYGKELMMGSEDFTEAVGAFLEKRKPVYKGR
jgi:enoyl-CoA hydratase